jgi:TetR/AcrR family transcriptional repressor of nem operon
VASTPIDTKEAIMAAARPMVQARGYKALSFRELAKEVGIKSSSLHYHFPTKDDLAAALARRYTEDLEAYLQSLTRDVQDTHERMTAYAEIFRGALLRGNRMCLCGMLAAERDDVSTAVQAEVEKFNEANVAWLSQVLAIHEPDSSRDAIQRRAFAILSAVEGAQLVARGCGDIRVYDRTIDAYRAAGLMP